MFRSLMDTAQGVSVFSDHLLYAVKVCWHGHLSLTTSATESGDYIIYH